MAAISPRDVLATVRAELGHKEKPQNDVKYNTAYYGRRVDGGQYPWCGTFLWWAFLQRGVDLRKHGIANPAGTNAFDADAYRNGWRRISKEKAEPGDVVFYDFGDVDGRGPDTADDDDHVGICSHSASGGYLKAIEGNTDGRGSRTGGQVMEQQRALSLVRHVYRPPYEKWSLELASASKLVAAKAKENDVTPADIASIVDKTADEIMARLATLGVIPNQKLHPEDPQAKPMSFVGCLSNIEFNQDQQTEAAAATRAVIDEIHAAVVKPVR